MTSNFIYTYLYVYVYCVTRDPRRWAFYTPSGTSSIDDLHFIFVTSAYWHFYLFIYILYVLHVIYYFNLFIWLLPGYQRASRHTLLAAAER